MFVAGSMTWLVRPAATVTVEDTPYSLRSKAREFLRLATEAKEPEMVEELSRLAQAYAARAREIERAATASMAGTQSTKPE
jgi:hypothetical protein